jgi:hypothetical protein
MSMNTAQKADSPSRVSKVLSAALTLIFNCGDPLRSISFYNFTTADFAFLTTSLQLFPQTSGRDRGRFAQVAG